MYAVHHCLLGRSANRALPNDSLNARRRPDKCGNGTQITRYSDECLRLSRGCPEAATETKESLVRRPLQNRRNLPPVNRCRFSDQQLRRNKFWGERYLESNLEIVEQNKQAKKFAPRLDSSVVTSWNGVGHSRKNEETSAHNDVATKLAFSAKIHRKLPTKEIKALAQSQR
ncbi:hypothetical protein C8J57DRAFT_1246563 [Mycena rebaudengoi]|nr:hypothetical protein C8J57DRAFT_1246563 [Mycena rebaudengoi]